MAELDIYRLLDQSGGKLKVDVFPQNQLGDNKELSEQTALGSLDMHVQGMGALLNYKVEEGYLSKVPFLFRSIEHSRQWWTSPEGMASTIRFCSSSAPMRSSGVKAGSSTRSIDSFSGA